MSAPTPLIPSEGTCIAELTLVVPNPTVLGSPTLEYRIGATSVMGPIAVPDGLTTAAEIQALIDGDATYIAYQASNPGFLITVTSFVDGALAVLITKPSTVQVTDNAMGIYNVDVTDSSSFVCNLAPNTNRNRGIGAIIDRMKKFPQRLCMARRYDPLNIKQFLKCPQTISYYGVIYDLVSSDDKKCCYEKRSLFSAKGLHGTLAGQTRVSSPGPENKEIIPTKKPADPSQILTKEGCQAGTSGCWCEYTDANGNKYFTQGKSGDCA